MKIVFVRSRRRRRTVAGKIQNEILEVRFPFWMPKFQAEKIAQSFLKKIEGKRKRAGEKESNSFLKKRAAILNKKYFDGKIGKFSINWSKRQTRAFGICNHRQKTIRISERIKKAPLWVIDYLLIHEMAHLLEPNHSKKFWQIVNQYPKAERAKGFLEGLTFKISD